MKHVWSFAGISPKNSVHCLGGWCLKKEWPLCRTQQWDPETKLALGLGVWPWLFALPVRGKTSPWRLGDVFCCNFWSLKHRRNSVAMAILSRRFNVCLMFFHHLSTQFYLVVQRSPASQKSLQKNLPHQQKPKLLRRSKEIRQVEGEIRSKAQGSLVAFLMVQHVPQCLGVVKIFPPKFDEGRYPQKRKRLQGWHRFGVSMFNFGGG